MLLFPLAKSSDETLDVVPVLRECPIVLLQNLTWPDLNDIKDRIFIQPLGSLEQHGLHLPLFTDSYIVSEVANRLESELSGEIMLLPTQWLGHSPHHRRFGCVSLDFQPYVHLIRGICTSLIQIGARKILLLNGHGGNDTPCKAAQRELKSDFAALKDLYVVYAAYWNLAAPAFNQIRTSPAGGMGHACEMETSVMLTKHPDLVASAKIRNDGPGPRMGYRLTDMLHPLPFTLLNEFDELSESGVIGMPELATAEKGERFLKAAFDAAIALVREMQTWNFQERHTAPKATQT